MTLNKARMVSELLGLDNGGGELHKLTIYYERVDPITGQRLTQGKIPALFNPSEISKSKSSRWEQQHSVGQSGRTTAKIEQEFRSVEAENFTIELFFDTYESRAASLIPGGQASDVRRYTDQIARLVDVEVNLHRPPVCDLRWGVFDIFTGVLIQVQQRFSLFLSDGTPVRATMSCTFTEVGTQAKAKANELHSADVAKKRTVRRYDTLQSLAADEYGDPALWRPIATANGIVNPLNLAPGTILTIPRLQA